MTDSAIMTTSIVNCIVAVSRFCNALLTRAITVNLDRGFMEKPHSAIINLDIISLAIIKPTTPFNSIRYVLRISDLISH
ncbi:hypothetical protein O9992_25890 [Vibrio lentus]|nr:hypothetical protein [Vibrio lentus]